MRTFTITLAIVLYCTFNILAQPFSTQAQWETYFKSKIQSLDPIEGIWSNSNTLKIYDEYNNLMVQSNHPQIELIAIYKDGSYFKVYSIDSETVYGKRTFQNTATAGIYLFETYYTEYSTAKATAILSASGLLEFSYEDPISQLKKLYGSYYYSGMQQTFDHKWIKISPQAQDYSKSQPASGTGFGISSNGIIVTNYHVIDGAKSIKVRGVNSNFTMTYKAKVLVSDKNNDLALLQIDENSFTSLGVIPYIIKTGLAGVGENIFVLGYPLRATMGDEIKLTNGIISSKTGFQGDITSYQISAPVQPGNSGGPLFNSQGNLIGIINAKHVGAENASYAVKSSYLTGLIELLTSPPKLQTVNSLSGKTLTQQVEMVKKFIYIIETE